MYHGINIKRRGGRREEKKEWGGKSQGTGEAWRRGVRTDWSGTGASRGGYDPLCTDATDQARHHKSQDQAETALKALLSLVAHMSGLLLGLAIPGLGQKAETERERIGGGCWLFVPVGGFSDINNMLVICGGDGLLP